MADHVSLSIVCSNSGSSEQVSQDKAKTRGLLEQDKETKKSSSDTWKFRVTDEESQSSQRKEEMHMINIKNQKL